MHDPRLTPTTRLVAYELSIHLNSVSCEAWPSQETMRRNLGIKNVKTIKRAIANLRRLGYIKVKYDRDTRRNTYVPVSKALESYGDISAVADRDILVNDGDIPCVGRGQDRQPDSDASVTQSSLNKSTQTILVTPSDQGATDPNAIIWLSVKNRLTAQVGANLARSWYDGLIVKSIEAGEVVMIAPGRFIKDYIESCFLGDRLNDAWRTVLPAVNAVRIVVGANVADQALT